MLAIGTNKLRIMATINQILARRAFLRDCNHTGAFLKLTRYEAGIERGLYRDLQALERLQTIGGKGVS
jgi:hypothetical protein